MYSNISPKVKDYLRSTFLQLSVPLQDGYILGAPLIFLSLSVKMKKPLRLFSYLIFHRNWYSIVSAPLASTPILLQAI